MAKPLKIFLGIVGTLVLLIVGAAIALPLLFDPNDYRDDIAKAVKENTGREFTLGHIELKVFPWLRMSAKDAQLGNAAGFGEQPFAKISEVAIGVKLLPLLFDGKVMVSAVTLSGLQLNMQKNADGKDNWSDIGKAKDDKPKVEVQAEGEIDINSIDIAGIEVKDATLSYSDAQAKTQYSLSDVQLSTGKLKPGEAFDLKLSAKAVSATPQANAEFELSGHIVPDAKGEHITIEDLKLKLKGEGFDLKTESSMTAKLTVDRPAQRYSVEGLQFEGEVQGANIPGGKQKLKFSSSIALDQAAGTVKLAGTRLEAADLVLTTEIEGSGLNGETPKLEGPISIAQFSPRKLLTAFGTKLDTADPAALSSASLSTKYSGDFTSARFKDLAIKLDQTSIAGSFSVRDFKTQALEFALKIDQLDADRYMAPKAAGAAKPEAAAAKSAESAQSDINAVKLPTDALEKLNASGTIDIGSLKANGVKLTDVRLRLSGGKGAAKQQDVTAKLYGGSIVSTSRISPGQQPGITWKTQLSALDTAPFLKDLTGKDAVSGLGSLSLDLTTRGDTVGAVRKALNGDVALKLENGAVKGFNLGALVRKARATLGGNLNYTETEPQKTDFTAVTFSGAIVNGILKSDQLDGASPLFRLAGAGEINLVNETLNYLAKPTIVESSSGQGGKGLDDLKGLTIPIRLTGSLFAPSYKIDIETALKQKAGEQLHKEYEKQEDKAKEKIKEKLGDFLFGKPKQQQPEQQPAPAPPPPT